METIQPTDFEKINQILLNQMQLQQLIKGQFEQLTLIFRSIETLSAQIKETSGFSSPLVVSNLRLSTTPFNGDGIWSKTIGYYVSWFLDKPNCDSDSDESNCEESNCEEPSENLQELVFFLMFGYNLLFCTD